MRLIFLLVTATAVTTVNGLSFVEVRNMLEQYSTASYQFIKRSLPVQIEGRTGTCPPIWTSVVNDLNTMFLDTSVNPSQCNDDARAAIRVNFPFILSYLLIITSK